MKNKIESVATIFLTAILVYFFSQHWLIENIGKLLEMNCYNKPSLGCYLTPIGVIFLFFLIYANIGIVINFSKKDAGNYLFESFIKGLIIGFLFGLFLGGVLSFANGIQSFLLAFNAGISMIFLIFLFKGIVEELKV